jgi:hypothetical protein
MVVNKNKQKPSGGYPKRAPQASFTALRIKEIATSLKAKS